MVYFAALYLILTLLLTVYVSRFFSGLLRWPVAFFLSVLITGILFALTVALLLAIMLFCPSVLKDMLTRYRNSKKYPVSFPVAAAVNRNGIRKPFVPTLFGLLVVLVFASCQKSPCVYNNCDETPPPVTTSCSYKIIDKFRYAMPGGSTMGAFQIGGTAGVGWFQHETTTYFIVVHDTLYNKYSKGQMLPVNPNP